MCVCVCVCACIFVYVYTLEPGIYLNARFGKPIIPPVLTHMIRKLTGILWKFHWVSYQLLAFQKVALTGRNKNNSMCQL